MKDIQGVVFDFDGVLALSEPAHFAAFARPAEERGLRMPEGFYHRMIGRTDEDCALELSRFWLEKVTVAEILQWKSSTYQRIGVEESKLVPGIHQFLSYLSKRGLPLGIATSAHRADIEPFLARYKWHDVFSTINTVEDVAHAKPDPEIYQLAIRGLGITPAQTLVFEDSPVGAQAARAANANVIGMLTSVGADALGETLDQWQDYRDEERWQRVFDRAQLG